MQRGTESRLAYRTLSKDLLRHACRMGFWNCRSTGVAWNAKFSPWTLPLLPVPLPPQENCALVDKKRTVDWHFRLAPIRLIPIVRRPCQNQIWEHHNRILIPLLWILNNTYSIFTRFFVAYARKAHHGQRKYFLKRHRRLLRFKTAILYIFSSISIDLPWTSGDLLYYGNICRRFSLLIEHLQNYMSDLYFSGSVRLSLRCRTNLNLYSLSRFFIMSFLKTKNFRMHLISSSFCGLTLHFFLFTLCSNI